MKDEYTFKKGKRGYYNEEINKEKITIRLGERVIKYFKNLTLKYIKLLHLKVVRLLKTLKYY